MRGLKKPNENDKMKIFLQNIDEKKADAIHDTYENWNNWHVFHESFPLNIKKDNNGAVNYRNFYTNTQATFKGCKIPKRKPDYISGGNSRYWYGEDKKGKYVIRASDHWCSYYFHGSVLESKRRSKIATCYWSIRTNLLDDKGCKRYLEGVIYREIAGKCYLNSFRIK